MKTTKLIAAFTAVVLIATGAHSQFRPVEPIRPIQPITVPALPNFQPLPTYSVAPSYSAAPSYSVAPSEPAKVEEAKIRAAASKRIYEHEQVTLTETTAVRYWKDDENYSARARFLVQGQNAAIHCVSSVKAIVVAFLEYINRVFQSNSSVDRSLETIASDARRNLRDVHSFSDDQITLYYIDQFGNSHVAQISRRQLEIMLASR